MKLTFFELIINQCLSILLAFSSTNEGSTMGTKGIVITTILTTALLVAYFMHFMEIAPGN